MQSNIKDSYERVGENQVKVVDTDVIPNIEEPAIFSIEPIFGDSEISDKGCIIAANSMIRQGQIGCLVCEMLRPVQLYGNVVNSIAVCKMCVKSCPDCGSLESIRESSEAVVCQECDLVIDY